MEPRHTRTCSILSKPSNYPKTRYNYLFLSTVTYNDLFSDNLNQIKYQKYINIQFQPEKGSGHLPWTRPTRPEIQDLMASQSTLSHPWKNIIILLIYQTGVVMIVHSTYSTEGGKEGD